MKIEKEDMTKRNFIIMIVISILLIFSIPLLSWKLYGKFTFNFVKAQEYAVDKAFDEIDCEWGAVSVGGGMPYCQEAPCKTYNTKGKECVREGYTGKGFLGLTDFNNEYYICEGYGRMVLSCIDYFDSQEEFREYLEDI